MSSGYYQMHDDPSSPQKHERNQYARPTYSTSAPAYQQDGYGMPISQRGSRWDPRSWSRRTIICVAVGLVVLLIIIIVAAVEGTKANAYPDYSKLNYALKDNYTGVDFFDNFEYFTGYDPSGGFVHYVDQPGSEQLNLTHASSVSAALKVDTSETDASTGRKSVRITSKNTYNDGLFIFDITHAPFGCGTWPALWLTDPSVWPANGEIDVVEAVNTATTGNQMTLHTTNGCSMSSVKRKETGTVLASNCYNGTNNNDGCGVQAEPATYGQTFNEANGGVYAMELRSAGIRMWFFPRGDSSLSTSITGGPLTSTPDPTTWGTALADFPSTDCNIGQHFRNQSIVANIDLCGQFAGQEKYYTQESHCPGNCTDYVATNPQAFVEAFWEFNGFTVFQAE